MQTPSSNVASPPLISPVEMARALLTCSGRIIITAHVRPDGDAVGSALALCLALRGMGRSAVCVGVEPISEAFGFLEGQEAMISAQDYFPDVGDVMAIVDCGDFSRIPEALQEHAKERIGFCIDHHKNYAGFAPNSLIDTSASSAAELVQAVIEAGHMPMNRAIAEALWVGMVTDTGRFSYPGTKPETLRRAAVLLELGTRFAMINETLFNTVRLCRLKLKRRLIASLEVSENGKVAVGSLSPDDYAAEQCEATESENFVDIVRSIKGVKIALFIRQTSVSETVNISLRTAEPFDAAQICAEWDGGGHARAAGATLHGSLAAQRDKVFARLQAIESQGEFKEIAGDRK